MPDTYLVGRTTPSMRSVPNLTLFLLYILYLVPTAVPWDVLPSGAASGAKIVTLCFALLLVPPIKNQTVIPLLFVLLISIFYIWLLVGHFYTPSELYSTFKSLMFGVQILIPIWVLCYLGMSLERLYILVFAIAIGLFFSVCNFAIFGEFVNSAMRVRTDSSGVRAIAQVMGIGFCIILCRMFYERSSILLQWLLFVTLMILLSVIVMTGTKSAVVGCVLTLFTLILFRFFSGKFFRTVLVVFSVSMFTFAILNSVLDFRELSSIKRIKGMIYVATQTGSFDPVRQESFQLAYEAFQSAPLIGIGTGGFASLDHHFQEENRVYPHNIFLEAMSENGIVGALLLSIILISGVVFAVHWVWFLSKRHQDLLNVKGQRFLQRLLVGDLSVFPAAFAVAYCFMLLNALAAGDYISNNRLFLMAFLVSLIGSETYRSLPTQYNIRQFRNSVRNSIKNN
ncbi:hypothetical protein OLMES_5524 [Oleiphilus messinensis]|uniref:O-antigen ligase-related domain-containing protein n=1 Tax=Oleiphilus messinensis TaxID=141451 RepID=A0A1Y0IJE1_9GAMM|nr:O-antigen ligase family protein [Oleiphilus messinensis]ARU59504.1 hypothetical protein OLMES_5524 [Oleiphilus messinensis]